MVITESDFIVAGHQGLPYFESTKAFNDIRIANHYKRMGEITRRTETMDFAK